MKIATEVEDSLNLTSNRGQGSILSFGGGSGNGRLHFWFTGDQSQ